MALTFKFVEKPGYKRWMGFLYGWGASIVIIGALFKILHWQGANLMLMVGMFTEAVIFFFSAFEKPHPEFDWDRVYPVLKNDENGKPLYPEGTAPQACGSAAGSQNILSDKLEEMLEKANVTPVVFEKLSSGLEKLTQTTQNLNNLPCCDTTFQGTRADPTRRASITGLAENNFTPAHLTWSVMEGMARELQQMYVSFLEAGGKRPVQMIGSGNGLRKNPWLQKVFEQVFQCPMTCSVYQEEAALGAALYAARNI